MAVDFQYDGVRLSFNAEVDRYKALQVMDVLHRMLNVDDPVRARSTPFPQRRRGPRGLYRFVENFLENNPGSTWEAIRTALIQAGYNSSKSSIHYLVHKGRVERSADDPPKYSAVSQGVSRAD